MSEVLSVLIPLDLKEDPERIRSSLDQFLNRTIEPVLLHVIDREISSALAASRAANSAEIIETLKNSAEEKLKDFGVNFGENVQTLVVEGSPFIEIIKLARDLKVDLIAMPAHSSHQNLQELFFGSTTERVIRGSTVPVFCLR